MVILDGVVSKYDLWTRSYYGLIPDCFLKAVIPSPFPYMTMHVPFNPTEVKETL